MHAVTKLEWKSPLEIVKYPDPRLRAVNAKIGVFDDSLQALAKEMLEIMYQ
jgi:peptide deformylase